ncbi:hypothetical protein [Telluria beijingensis]|uniref:hypothetical protein n=1 Tax=Telluria beijingensis TaxID=3068633 RepID=UPI0027953B5D|nr:hypothetical protein [Massilia sp. REN29]
MRLDEITHTARSNYLCACCGMTVPGGSRYVRAQVPGGGLVAKKPMHTACYTRRAASNTNMEKAHERNI